MSNAEITKVTKRYITIIRKRIQIADSPAEAATIARDILSMTGGEARSTFSHTQLDQLQTLLCRATAKANGR